MAKLSVDEFNAKYSEKITDNDDLVIELMEDFSDSISASEEEELNTLRQEIEDKKAELIEVKRKYKERFLSSVEKKDDDIPEIIEKNIVDIKEI